MNWAAQGIGGFYVVAGLIALRHILISWLLDRRFADTIPQSASEQTADRMLAACSVLLLASGLALLMLQRWAIIAFLACWSAQAVYLLWAQRWFQPKCAVSTRGRRDTVNAFAIYSVATGVVIGLPLLGVLD